MALKDKFTDIYQIDPEACNLEQLVQFRQQAQFLIKHYADQVEEIDIQLLGHMKRIGGTSLYGPELPDGTPSFVVEKEEKGASYDRFQFRAMAEIFTAKEYEECYVPEAEETRIIPETWKTSTVKKYARKHGSKALEIFNNAKIDGNDIIKIVHMKEGGEIDPRND